MKTFRCRFEARQQGSLGVFEWTLLDVLANDEEQARQAARGKLADRDLETRGCAVRELLEVHQCEELK